MCREIRPARIYLDVTNACQLRCLHCCTEAGLSFENELEATELNNIVDQIQALQVENVVFSGGEPLMRNDFPEILEHAHAKGLNITLLTNGLLIDAHWARFLSKLNIRVKVSLDGVTAQTHDFLRGRGAFAKLLRSIKLLQEAGIDDLVVHFTIHRQNCRELLKLSQFLPKLGVKNLVVGIIKPSGRAKVNAALLIPPIMVPYVRQKVDILSKSENITLQQFSDRGWEGFGCPATCNKFGITATGAPTTCTFLGGQFIGNNFRDFSLADLWQQHLNQEEIFIVNESCRGCSALEQTGGGCRALALYYHQDVNATDPYCCAMHQKTLFLDNNVGFLQNELDELVHDSV